VAAPRSLARAQNTIYCRVLPATRKNYDQAKRHWLAFCSRYLVHPVEDVTLKLLCLFTDWLADRPTLKKFSAIEQYINGLKDFFAVAFAQPALDLLASSVFKFHLAGVERRLFLEQPPAPRSPFEHLFAAAKGRITRAILLSILPHFPRRSITDLNIIDLIIFAQTRLMRLGEVAATPGNRGSVPVADDFTWVAPDQRSLFLAHSKTDKHHAGTYVAALRLDAPLDPVRALDNIFFRSHTGSYCGRKPFFCTQHGAPISAASIRHTLKQALKAAGFQPDDFSGHSLRRGGAQDLFDSNVSPLDIMAVGRWTSNCWARYVAMPMKRRTAILTASRKARGG
jgi:hypothetical protein